LNSDPHTTCFADRVWHGRAAVVRNVQLARDTYRVTLDCPQIARRILPGQFVMLRLAGSNDPLLGRPLALYDTVLDASGATVGIDVVYLVVGNLTSKLARARSGDVLEVWGPLGNGFVPRPTGHLVMVAGGIGQTPFLAVAREQLGLRVYGDPPREAATAGKVTLCYGVRGADYLAGLADFGQLGIAVETSTDDGSAGRHGQVTEVLADVLDANDTECQIVCCGPLPMMKAVAGLAQAYGIECQISLETPMACGVGICFSCVARVREAGGGWDYRRTCVEGPVFDAESIEFA